MLENKKEKLNFDHGRKKNVVQLTNQCVGIRSALKPNYFIFFLFCILDLPLTYRPLIKLVPSVPPTCPLHFAPLIKLAPSVPSTPTLLMWYH